MTKQGCRQVAETDIQVSAPRERSGEPHHGPQSLTPRFRDIRDYTYTGPTSGSESGGGGVGIYRQIS